MYKHTSQKNRMLEQVKKEKDQLYGANMKLAL